MNIIILEKELYCNEMITVVVRTIKNVSVILKYNYGHQRKTLKYICNFEKRITDIRKETGNITVMPGEIYGCQKKN